LALRKLSSSFLFEPISTAKLLSISIVFFLKPVRERNPYTIKFEAQDNQEPGTAAHNGSLQATVGGAVGSKEAHASDTKDLKDVKDLKDAKDVKDLRQARSPWSFESFRSFASFRSFRFFVSDALAAGSCGVCLCLLYFAVPR